MRLVHTADWHLGKKLLGHDRLEEQVEWLAALVDYVREEQVDALLIAGDVFDRSVPPVEALALFGDTLEALTDLGCEVVVIAGNHDSAARLGFARKLFEHAGVHMRTSVSDAFTPILLEKGDDRIEVFALPYADPDSVFAAVRMRDGQLPEDVPREHGAAVDSFVQNLPSRQSPPCPRIFVAHVFCVGGVETPDSERPISTGGVGHVDPSVLDEFDYVALGHLHRPQQVAGRSHIRYSGSPLKYSVSEHLQDKGITRVEIQNGDMQIEHVRLSAGRDIVVLTESFENLLDDEKFASHENDFVAAYYTDSSYVLNAASRLSERFPFLLQALPKRLAAVVAENDSLSRDTGSPAELLSSFWNYARVEHTLEPEQVSVFVESLEKSLRADAPEGAQE